MNFGMSNVKKYIIGEKSFRFAVRIINLYKMLSGGKKEFVLSKQLLRSGTSTGANGREALFTSRKQRNQKWFKENENLRQN